MKYPAEDLKEQIQKSIKETSNFKEKIVLIALNHHLDRKKQLDEEREKEIRLLILKYDNLSFPIFEEQNQIILGRSLKEEELSKSANFLTEDEEK